MISSNIKYIKYKKIFFLYLLLILVTLGTYHKLPGYNFVDYDDPVYVTNNQVVQQGISVRGIKLAFTTFHASNWHPLTWLSHMLDCQFFGMNLGMHHLTSLLIHMANSLLLMQIFYRMTNAVWKSFLVALFFAVHPMHVESVAWISERKDVLSAFFWMLTLFFYVRYAEEPVSLRYAFVVLFFIFGLLSKPMVVTLPFVLLLLDFWPLERFQFLRLTASEQKDKKFPYQSITALVLEKIPLILFSVVASWITLSAQSLAIGALDIYPNYLRLGNVIVSYVNYILKMIIPIHLAVFYPYPEAIPGWKIFCSGIFLLLITVFAANSTKKNPYFLMGWFWFLGTLIPVIGIVQVGLQSMADRYTYLPFIGLFIMIVWGFEKVLFRNEHAHKIIYLMSVISFSCLILTAYFQTFHWKNTQLLFKHATEVVENNWLAFNNLGVELRRKGDIDGAANNFKKAITYKISYIDAYNNLGTLLARTGNFQDAVFYFQKALHIDPENILIKKHLNNALEDIERQRTH